MTGTQIDLVKRHLPLARRLASRYAGRGEPLEDLVQVAHLGLVQAANRYDPGHGSAFTSFAIPTILGELKRHFRDTGWAMRVPRGLQERALRVEHASKRLSQSLGRAPSAGELADLLGLSAEDVLEAMEAYRAYEADSLDAAVAADDPEPRTLAESFGQEDPGYELVHDRAAMSRGWSALRPLERQILALRYGEELTQREIADRIGYSQMHVSRTLRSGLERLSTVARAGLASSEAA